MKSLIFCQFVLICVSITGSSGVVAQESAKFESLFNGTNLDGWYGVKTLDPRKMAAMSADELEKFKAKSAEPTREHWTVENNEIVNDGKGPYLTTVREFSNCLLYTSPSPRDQRGSRMPSSA